jgi:hypothetical protein
MRGPLTGVFGRFVVQKKVARARIEKLIEIFFRVRVGIRGMDSLSLDHFASP